MNPTLCREHLAELIREELALLADLHTLLDGERAVIGSGDLKGLQRSTAMRQQRAAALAVQPARAHARFGRHGAAARLVRPALRAGRPAARVPRERPKVPRAQRPQWPHGGGAAEARRRAPAGAAWPRRPQRHLRSAW